MADEETKPTLIDVIKTSVATAHAEAESGGVLGKPEPNPFGEVDNPFGVVADSPAAPEPKSEEVTPPPAEAAPQAEPDREGDATEQRVPYERFSKKVEQHRVAEADNERLKKENAELREKTSEVDRQRIVKEISEADPPDGYEDWAQTQQQAWVAAEAHKRLQELGGRTISAEALEGVQTIVIEHRLMKALPGLTSGEQVDAVRAVWEASGEGGISEVECLSVARARDAELFAVQQPEQQDAVPVTTPPTHTTLDPALLRAAPGAGGDAELTALSAEAERMDQPMATSHRLKGFAAHLKRGFPNR
jgi:hypothetical protein